MKKDYMDTLLSILRIKPETVEEMLIADTNGLRGGYEAVKQILGGKTPEEMWDILQTHAYEIAKSQNIDLDFI